MCLSGAAADRQSCPVRETTPQEVQERFDRLTEILSGIVTQADAQASTRCPYRDRHDHCTAKFRCRNQSDCEDHKDSMCGHDGVFDYRSAWESDPRTLNAARERLERQNRQT